jgi:hypothetical protein
LVRATVVPAEHFSNTAKLTRSVLPYYETTSFTTGPVRYDRIRARISLVAPNHTHIYRPPSPSAPAIKCEKVRRLYLYRVQVPTSAVRTLPKQPHFRYKLQQVQSTGINSNGIPEFESQVTNKRQNYLGGVNPSALHIGFMVRQVFLGKFPLPSIIRCL